MALVSAKRGSDVIINPDVSYRLFYMEVWRPFVSAVLLY